MLRRFESVRDGGIFENFRWIAEANEFQRINLVIGSNGVGKSSLARALDIASNDASGAGCRKLSCRVSDLDGGNARTTGHQPDDEFERIFVFSDRYVARSHRFDETPEMDAVLTLGEKTVDAEAQIERLRTQIEAKQSERDAAKKAIDKGGRDLTAAFNAVRDTVVTDLSRAGGDYRSNGTYGARVRSRFNSSHAEWESLSENRLAANKQLVASDSLAAINCGKLSIGVREGLRSEADALLAATPVSIVLDTLTSHPGAAGWVDAGRHHHDGVETCIFCGSALTDDRKNEIEAHFSTEVTSAQQGLDNLIKELGELSSQLDRAALNAPNSGLLAADLRKEYEASQQMLAEQIDQLQQWAKPLRAALETKRSNVLEKSNFTTAEPPTVDGTPLEKLVATHNERVANHETLMKEAAVKVERHHLKVAEKNVEAIEDGTKNARNNYDEAEADLKAYGEEIASLESVEGDPLPTAKTLNVEVARLLGRSELTFELASNHSKYRVMRHGEPAVGLSTGERRAITLVHFFESVRRTDVENPIVVIDDPVSSLDADVATGIATYIWNEAVVKGHIAQVFVLTHSFDLFKQLDFQIDGLRSKELKTTFPAERYELTATHQLVGGNVRRVPQLRSWPPSADAKRKLRSSYHHAFISVAKASIALHEEDTLERRLDAQLLYPNVLRRMLETFLAFKRPQSVGDFNGIMRASAAMLEEAGFEGDADLIRLRLTRFTNTYSHDESSDTDITLSPNEIGPTISAVFAFMNALDADHFAGLCEIVGVEPADLLVATPTSSADEIAATTGSLW